MTDLKITAGPFVFGGRLEVKKAPATCASFLKLLPYRQKLIHVKWSGEGAWVPLGEFPLGFLQFAVDAELTDIKPFLDSWSVDVQCDLGQCGFAVPQLVRVRVRASA